MIEEEFLGHLLPGVGAGGRVRAETLEVVYSYRCNGCLTCQLVVWRPCSEHGSSLCVQSTSVVACLALVLGLPVVVTAEVYGL